MTKRILGNTSIEISPVGLGCMGLSYAFGTPLEKAEAAEIAKIDEALNQMGLEDAAAKRIRKPEIVK